MIARTHFGPRVRQYLFIPYWNRLTDILFLELQRINLLKYCDQLVVLISFNVWCSCCVIGVCNKGMYSVNVQQ